MTTTTSKDLNAQVLATYYDFGSKNSHITIPQLEFRIEVVKQWGIPMGSRVLDIGCGQGDSTIVLAAAVGEEGHVDAVDPAELTYGSPWTVEKSRNALKAGPLGPRMTFHQSDPVAFLTSTSHNTTYDYIVLFNCIWYFDSPARLQGLLRTICAGAHIRPGGALLLAEFSLQARSPQALPHVLSALTIAGLEAHNPSSIANIRTVISPSTIRRMVEEQGMVVLQESLVAPPVGHNDGMWETRMLLEGSQFAEDVQRYCAQNGKVVVFLEAMREAVRGAFETAGGEANKRNLRSMDVWTAKIGVA